MIAGLETLDLRQQPPSWREPENRIAKSRPTKAISFVGYLEFYIGPYNRNIEQMAWVVYGKSRTSEHTCGYLNPKVCKLMVCCSRMVLAHCIYVLWGSR